MNDEEKSAPLERKIIKSGNLSKKGHKRHNWKTRWFVLYNDGLAYFKSKKETALQGEVNLRGCSIISPCPEYTKRDCVFRLIEHCGREFLVQSSDKQTREEWTKAIAEIIRDLEMIPESKKRATDESCNSDEDAEECSCQPSIFETKVSCMELLDAMQDKEAGIPLQSFKIDGSMYKHCFTGKDIVDWLLHWAFITSRSEGVQACGELLEKAHLHPVGPLRQTSFKRKSARRIFCDNVTALYRFAAVTKDDDELDMIFEEESSDSEDESVPILESDIGDIVKKGYLLKKGHVRHNWKIRKFVLRNNPISLFYYKPNRPKAPQGRIPLKESSIADTVSSALDREIPCIGTSCLKAASLKAYRHEFQIKTKKGIIYELKAESEEEKLSWIEKIQFISSDGSNRCFSV